MDRKKKPKPLQKSSAEKARARFMKHVLRNPEDPGACWVWTGAKNRLSRSAREADPKRETVYGHTSLRGRNMLAHRVSFILFRGDLLPGFVVMHTCDNGLCVNPRHLVPGNASANQIDSYTKGRHYTLEGSEFCRSGRHRLSEAGLRSVKSNGKQRKTCAGCAREAKRRSYYRRVNMAAGLQPELDRRQHESDEGSDRDGARVDHGRAREVPQRGLAESRGEA